MADKRSAMLEFHAFEMEDNKRNHSGFKILFHLCLNK